MAYPCYFMSSGYNERFLFFIFIHERLADLTYQKKDVHFPIELMYEQCVSAVGCKNVYETIPFT